MEQRRNLEIDWEATLLKWRTAITTLRLNLSKVARDSGVTRQHITGILNGDSIPSIVVAERIDRAIDLNTRERQEAARAMLGIQKGAKREEESDVD